MQVQIFQNRDALIHNTAEKIAHLINIHPQHTPFVLGLSTGATVLSICEALVNLHKAGKVSFKNVVTFHAGSYIGLEQADYYRNLLQNQFFNQIDILDNASHFLNGNATDLEQECSSYEAKITSIGGFSLFVGSLGQNGNLAFNEPGSSLSSRTRIKSLTEETLQLDARFFNNEYTAVPQQALTIGIQTILESKKIMITVYGIQKAFVTKACIEEAVSNMYPASILQMHEHSSFMIDKVAARFLSSVTRECFSANIE